MKKILSVLVAVVIVALACVPAFAAAPAVELKTPAKAAVGDKIVITVDVNEGVTGLNTTVKYDPDYLELTSTEATELMQTEINDGKKSAVELEKGTVIIASASKDPVKGGTVAKLFFTVKKVDAKVSATVSEYILDDETNVADQVKVADKVIAAGEKAASSTTDKKNSSSKKGTKSVNVPDTGASSVVASASVVLMASAAVALLMKKKNED